MPFGPFDSGCSPLERARLLGLLEGLTHVLGGRGNPVPAALRRAQSGASEDLVNALLALNSLPAVQRRNVLSCFAACTAPNRPTPTRRERAA